MAAEIMESIYEAPDKRLLLSAVQSQSDKIRSYHLPLKYQLLQRLETYGQVDVPAFVDVRECTTPANMEKLFEDAWKAIERGSMKKLKDSLRLMKAAYSHSESYLDICCLQTTVSHVSEKVVVYYMTFLAHAAVHQRLDMVKFLIKEGASLQVDNVLTGTPLTQLLVYSMLHGTHNAISLEIVNLLISPATLNIVVYYDIPINEYDSSGQTTPWVASPLSFAILLQRIDVAALLTEKGADPLLDLGDGALTCMVEYLHFGTNKFFTWLFQEHLLAEEITKFIEQLLPAKGDILSEECASMFNDYYKHPAHALLTCGNEEVIRNFLAGDMTLLSEKDPNGKTALQIAAGQGDVASVKLLLKACWNQPNVNMNMKEALLAAAQSDHTEIVSCLLQRDFSLGAQIVEDLTTSKSSYTDLSLLSSIFETFRDYKQELLLHKVDKEDNTISHIAAANGNSKLFKVTFPLKSLSMMFGALKRRNTSQNTPIHLAIQNGNLNILKSLQAFGVERKHKQGAEQKKEEQEWKEVWESIGSELLIHACSSGSVEAVQILWSVIKDCGLHLNDRVNTCLKHQLMHQLYPSALPRMMLDPSDYVWKEGLCNAASTGKRNMMKYFLGSEDISKHLSSEDVSEALLLASAQGHTRCVELVLQGKMRVNVQRQSDDGSNCLMKAIQGNHRETVLTIVSDANHGFESLRVCRHVKTIDSTTTPMRMLIVYMPDIAEWVLNACVLAGTKSDSSQGDIEDTQRDEFEFLDVTCYMSHSCAANPVVLKNKGIEQDNDAVQLMELSNGTVKHHPSDKTAATADQSNTASTVNFKQERKCFTSFNHPLKMMVKHDREALLHHPLVKKYINYKWITIGIVGLAFYFALYLIFLTLLTSFALLVPRPGPGNNLCTAMITDTANSSLQVNTLPDEENVTVTTAAFMPDLTTTPDGTSTNPVGNETITDNDNSSILTTTTTMADLASATTDFAMNISELSMNTTETPSVQDDTNNNCAESPGVVVLYVLRSTSVILMIFSGVYLFLEVLQIYHRGKQYFGEFENYIQVAMYTLTIAFVHPPGLYGSECWCFSSWRWQVGAVALFLAWFNCCFLLKDWPLVGQPVTMLVHVYFNFFKLVYLPILLILTFGFPLYMLHVQEGTDVSTSLLTFGSPIGAIWNIVLQTTGELDTTTVFINTPLLYPILTYILLVLFIIAMPLLFNNFLIGMAVGETEEERKKASLTLIKMKIRYTFEVENALRFLRIKNFCHCCHKLWRRSQLDQLKLDRIEKRNKKFVTDMKSKFNAEDNQAELNALREEMKALKLIISNK